ncbi:hypothetical protein [Candidatus Leptofilum sp.]|uniref:hypothetical protein n=1 Tax=Candidatus Leptofilum sp. TaxID=3241576 RepID=UPI003B5AD40B
MKQAEPFLPLLLEQTTENSLFGSQYIFCSLQNIPAKKEADKGFVGSTLSAYPTFVARFVSFPNE